MTEDQKKIKRYVNRLERRLRLPVENKARINEDIGTEIHLRMESGKTANQVIEEMGSPEKVAEHFNEEYSECQVKRNPVRFIFLGVAVLIGLGYIICGIDAWYAHRQMEGLTGAIIGGADGPTAIFLAGKFPDNNWLGWGLSCAGIFLGCIAAYFFVLYGKNKTPRKYIRCVLLSAIGLIVGFIPWFVSGGGGSIQWSLPVGVSEITVMPGVILNAIVLVCSLRRYLR